MEMQEVPRMSPGELRDWMMHGEEFVVLDVRTDDARSAKPYQIPGARWLPLAEVVLHADSLPRHGKIVIY
ncbi:MAG: rhodanese-like domain-containing protein [Candidatus Binatia bacterium]